MTPPRETTDPGSLKTQLALLHSMLHSMTENNEAAHSRIKATLDSVLTTLNGNGKPGLCSRLHVLETKTAGLMFVAGAVVTAIVAWLVKGWVGK